MDRKLGVVVAVAIGAAVAAGGAFAADQAGAIQARQGHMKEQGAAFRAVFGELRKDAPDKAVLATNTAKMKELAAGLPSWFPKGSGPEAGVKTDAKSEAWSDAAGFAAVADKFKADTAKLDELAQAGDIAGAKTQAAAVGGDCKACHDKYRVPPPPAAPKT